MPSTTDLPTLPIPADGRLHHEDLLPGTYRLEAEKRVTKEEIIAFARAYDPQPFHLDEEAAKASMLGALCASGYHNCSMQMRLLCDGYLSRAASQGAPGIDEVKWLKPVMPGDILTMRLTIGERRVMASRPHIGVSRVRSEMVNQRGEVAMSSDYTQFIGLRHPVSGTPARQAAPSTVTKASETPGTASMWDAQPLPAGVMTDAMARGNHIEYRVIGEVTELGSHTFGRDDIMEFARTYDPQPFHLDEAAAKASIFGGLAASGWHTAAHYIRHFVGYRQCCEAMMRERGIRVAAYGPSPGIKNLRWIKPVFVGDTVTYRTRTAARIDLKSRPDRGLLITDSEGRNQRGEIVFALTSQVFAERRERYVGGS